MHKTLKDFSDSEDAKIRKQLTQKKEDRVITPQEKLKLNKLDKIYQKLLANIPDDDVRFSTDSK